MKAVVLAAGEGVRLHPLTLTRPKHTLPIGGKPLLEHILLSLKGAGLNEALVIVHHMAEHIKQYFGDGSKIGMTIEYLFQPKVRGTADATALAEPYVENEFLMIYGDLLVTPAALQSVLRLHEKGSPSVSMAVVSVNHSERYGVVKLDGSYLIDIVEKPPSREAPTNLANAGVYVLSTEIFEKIRKTNLSQRGECEITDSLRLLIKDNRQISVVQIPRDEWLDIGRPWDLLEANQRVLSQLKPRVDGRIEEGVHLIGPVEIGKRTRVRSGSYIEGPVFIDEDSDIGPNCYIRPYTSLGKGVRIGNACEIKNSVIMNKTSIGHLSYVGDSIIGEDSNLGAGTVIANYRLDGDGVKMTLKEKFVNSEREKLGAIVGDSVKTGINALLMPGVKIGPNSWIGPNVVVYNDVPTDAFLLLKQNIEEREKGAT